MGICAFGALILAGCGQQGQYADQDAGWVSNQPTAVCSNMQGQRVPDSYCQSGSGLGTAVMWYYLGRGMTVPYYGYPLTGGYSRPYWDRTYYHPPSIYNRTYDRRPYSPRTVVVNNYHFHSNTPGASSTTTRTTVTASASGPIHMQAAPHKSGGWFSGFGGSSSSTPSGDSIKSVRTGPGGPSVLALSPRSSSTSSSYGSWGSSRSSSSSYHSSSSSSRRH